MRLRPKLGNWGGFIVLLLILAFVAMLIFSTVLRTVLVGMAILIVLAVMLYYLGLRIDKRLRHGKQTTKVKPSNDAGGGQPPAQGGQQLSQNGSNGGDSE